MSDSSIAVAPRRFSTGYKTLWGLASFGIALISGIYGALLPIFYQDYLGLAARWIALASAVYAIWNAINDPLFGFITDNTRSRLGRRIPYMRFTAPFLALTFILVWLAPPKAGQQALFWWMLVSMLLYDTCYTIIGLVYSALVPEMTEDDAERNSIQIWGTLFGLLGTLLGFLIPDFFRPKAGESPSFFPLQISMVVVGVISLAAILPATFRVKERLEFTRVDEPLKIKDALRYSLTSRSFLILLIQSFAATLMQSLVMGALYYLADYVLHMNTVILLIWVFVPLMAAVPVTAWLRARVGVVGAQQVMLAIAGVGLTLVTVAPVSLVPVCVALGGFGIGGVETLSTVLFAQVADEDELRTGVRREGAFFGINALFTKPAQSIAIALSPFVLEATHFVTREANGGQIFLDQPASALFGIRVVTGLIPGIAMLLAAGLLSYYPLRGEYLKKVQSEVLALHAAKQTALENQNSSQVVFSED